MRKNDDMIDHRFNLKYIKKSKLAHWEFTVKRLVHLNSGLMCIVPVLVLNGNDVTPFLHHPVSTSFQHMPVASIVIISNTTTKKRAKVKDRVRERKIE